jgi:hypothetical protein
MSAIARGYALSGSALERVNFYAADKDWEGMGEHLHEHEIPEKFAWTGYAIAILSVLLSDQGIKLPRDLDPTFSSFWANVSVVLLCTQAMNLQALRQSLFLEPLGENSLTIGGSLRGSTIQRHQRSCSMAGGG